MGFIKAAKADKMSDHARRAAAEGRSIFIAQFRGAVSHSPVLSRPIADIAEMIEAVEREGWHLDQFTSVPWKDNMTITGLFRRAVPQVAMTSARWPAPWSAKPRTAPPPSPPTGSNSALLPCLSWMPSRHWTGYGPYAAAVTRSLQRRSIGSGPRHWTT